MAGYRDIRARTDTQGSTLMARATGGSSKVTYPRKPRTSSFPFTRPAGRLSRNLYLPTLVQLHDGVPPPTRELELLDPGRTRADKPPLCRSDSRQTRPISLSASVNALAYLSLSLSFTWVALSPCSSRLADFCSLTGPRDSVDRRAARRSVSASTCDNDTQFLRLTFDS